MMQNPWPLWLGWKAAAWMLGTTAVIGTGTYAFQKAKGVVTQQQAMYSRAVAVAGLATIGYIVYRATTD